MIKVNLDSRCTLSSDEIEKAMAPKKQALWIKDVGVQDLTIDSATNLKKDGSEMVSVDPNWAPVVLTLSNTKGQKISHYLLTPIDGKNDYAFIRPGKTPSRLPFSKFVNFVKSVGADIQDFRKLVGLTDHYFGSCMKTNLIGKTVRANIQYQGLHIRYMGKQEDTGATQYQLFHWNNPYEIREGEVAPILTGYQACENHALGLGIEKSAIQPFPKIAEFERVGMASNVHEVSDESMAELPF